VRSNSRSRRGYISARIKPALFIAIMFVAALALTGDFARLVPTVFAIDRGTGSVSLTTLGAAVTQNFDTLANTAGSTTNETLPTGWYITESGSGARDNDQYAVDTGGSNTGDTFSYGAAGSTDRALGGLQSGTLIPIFGAQFTNNTGSTITSLDIAYTGEQWRIANTAAARDDRLDFQISTDATNLCGPDSGTCVGTYTDVNALDFTNPIKTAAAAGALDGNNAANRTALSTTISSLNIPNGATFWIRWTDLNASGADDGLAADNFSITPQGAGGGVTLAVNDVSQDEGNAGQTAFTFTVSLSSATHGGVTFDIATADGTAQDDNPTTEDNDYQANSATGVSIPNGQQSAQFTVQVNGDTTTEPNETFFVNVTSVTGATVTDGQGQGTIVNDDFVLIPIHDIQGNGTASPLVGQIVTTTGVVTLLKTGANGGNGAANGFFLQTPDAGADADPNTSQGIFVFTSSVPTVGAGDEVRVTGTAVEFNGLTEISSVTNVSVIDTGNTLPTAVTLDTTILDPAAAPTQPQLEKFEGMRLAAASLRTTAPTDNFFDVPAVLSTVPRPLREPGIPAGNPIPPDPTTGSPDCCIPIFDRNPERIKLDTNGRAGAPINPYTSNVTFTNVAGPLDFAFGEYRLVTEAGFTASANMSAVPVPTPFSTEFTVAGFNIENFVNTTAAGPTQRRKAALAIVRVMHLPDIIGHAEIFDLGSLTALATEVNTQAVADGHPNPMYEARLIPTPVAGITQNVGFLVKTARVRIDAVTQERAASTYIRPSDGTTDETHDRPPLVLRATVEPTGANKPVIVVVNHTRSFIDIELVAGDGPNVRAKRKAQAEDIAGLFQELQTGSPGVPVIAVGDYNAFQFNNGYDDPIAVMKGNPTPDEQIVVDASPDLVNPNFFNLIDELPAEERYTFIFSDDQQAQVLDHVLVNTVAHDINTRIFIARNNADFPEIPPTAFASDATRPERNSDHDMPVAYFSLFPEAQAGQVLISELRLRGPNPSATPGAGENNEFIELYNNTNNDITVAAADGSEGWSVAMDVPVVAALAAVRPSAPAVVSRLFVIPNGTIIPARGHYLAANSIGYSLNDYAAPDVTYGTDIPDDAGVALFTTANTANYELGTRLDAAGILSLVNSKPGRAAGPSTFDPLYYEGDGLPGPVTTDNEHSYVRRLNFGTPQDRNDNLTDFIVVSNSPGTLGVPGLLGAPGPENSTSPVQRNSKIKSIYLDSLCAGGAGTALANPVPGVSPDGTPVAGCQNRARDTTPLLATQSNTSAQGTLYIRRRFINTTSQNVTRLRFRIVDITTSNGGPVPAGTADLRALSAGDVTITTTGGEIVQVRGLTLETPPAQPDGGGYNSSLAAGTVTPAEPLAPGNSIAVQFRLGVQQAGTFRFFVNVEADLSAPVVPFGKAANKFGDGRDDKR
jgi:predicted extracellular nuclease